MKFSHYVEAPDAAESLPRPWLFLAGGITGVRDWQSNAKWMLLSPYESGGGTLINPRRTHFDVTNPNNAREQITWEHKYLAASDAILFWFQHETLQPIVLFELGRWSNLILRKPIFVGVHPEYERRQDVIIQMELERPEIPVVDDFMDLCRLVRNHY